jgi:ketosteroid isomerase-like protein
MTITRRFLATAGAIALTVTSVRGHAESADDAAVRKAVETLVKAITAADKAALDGVVSDQLSFGHADGRVEDKAAFVGGIVAKKVIYKSVTIEDPKITVAGNNAIARYPAAVEVEAGGRAISLKLGIMTVWVKDGGSWKLLAHQSFRT